MNLGEISAGSDQNNQPTCPYCHGAVEIGTKPLENVKGKQIEVASQQSVGTSPKSDHACGGQDELGPASEPMVEFILKAVTGSLEESRYAEFSEDIMYIVRTALEPKAGSVKQHLTKMVLEANQPAEIGLTNLEESFDEEGVLIARAISDVAVEIGDLNERMLRIEGTIRSIQKQATVPSPKLCEPEETNWQEM